MVHHFIALLLSCTLFIHSKNADSFQAKHTNEGNQKNVLEALYTQLKNPQYRKEILPNDFSYLVDIIQLGNKNNQPPAYLRSAIKMFSNMLKSADYVNAHAFSTLIEKFPTILPNYFSLNACRAYIPNQALYDADMFDRFKATVNNLLYVKFSSDYESFKSNPGQFLQSISSEIVAITQEEVAREQLRQAMIRFCEIALSKLIWNPAEQEQTWQITKKIADQLAALLEHNILDDANDLDDLYWTLLNRYCYFIELTATDMNESFYTIIKSDISASKSPLFELEEQDFIVEPKLSYMQRTLIEAEAISRGYARGLIRS